LVRLMLPPIRNCRGLGELMHQRVAMLIATAATFLAVACGQSDPGITAAVKARLIGDTTVKAYQIDVDTSDKVVTLSGIVATEAARERAIAVARQTDGVREVVDRITVDPQRASTAGTVSDEIKKVGQEIRQETQQAAEAAKRVVQDAGEEARDATKEAAGKAPAKVDHATDVAKAAVTDAAITSAVKTKFLADTAVSGLKIDVDTDGGVVTLSGSVASRAEATRAMALARDTSGVKRVVDRLKVEAK
jgi:hyperosmotically inducible periplasmic protein